MLLSAVLVLLIAGSAVCCHLIARRRGANAVFWGVMGALFGPLALPFAFLSKPRVKRQTER